MRGGPGEDYGGVRKQNPGKENLAKNQGLGQEALELNLARRPRWGGGSLRAFRRAASIFDVVSFECRVDGVAGAIAVASIFLLEFWFFQGGVLGLFWASGRLLGFLGEHFCLFGSVFWSLWGSLGVSWGFPWGVFGGPMRVLGRS